MASPTIAIVGPGAVGGVMAWALSRAGAAPMLLVRSPASAAALKSGLTVQTPDGRRETVQVQVTHLPQEVGPVDLVFGTLKGHDWPAAAPAIHALMGPQTRVVPVLNGIPWWYFDGDRGPLAGRKLVAVDPDGALAQALPADRLIGCVANLPAERRGPAECWWRGSGAFVLGATGAGTPPDLEPVVKLLTEAGFTASQTPDIRQRIWGKLLLNAAYNPLSVAAGADMGVMTRSPHLRRVVRAAMEEVARIAAAAGAPTTESIDDLMRHHPRMVGARPSMMQDWEAGRDLELAGIVEAVIEIGTTLGIATPVLTVLRALAAEAAARRASP